LPYFVGPEMKNKSSKPFQFESLFIGRDYRFFPKISSTNVKLKTLISETHLQEGAVVSAGFQTEGRGQAGTVWESETDQNIMLSILLYPSFLKAGSQFTISEAIALGVHDFMHAFLPDSNIYIKWPNDIIIDGKKICGILIENALQGEQIAHTICGIGINVNEIPGQKDRTSLKAISGLEYDLRYLEKVLFSFIEARYLKLKSNPDSISIAYLSKLFGFEKHIQFIDLKDQSRFKGLIIGINTDGRLLVETDNGLKLFALKEVKFEI
jgi:BirA family transcriptional regulator, biotin operon repressor / biotin---[acetyl-CoA-carboxylase] ligase